MDANSGEVIGFYCLLANSPIPAKKSDKRFKGKRGLEGVALGVHPAYRGSGIATELIRQSEQVPEYDYIWGMAFEELQNLDFWKRFREVFLTGQVHITYKMLKPKS